jgi:large subunit ribosomal protein L9
MKVYLLKDIEKIGMSGEIIKVSDGYAHNYLVPRNLAVIITPENEALYTQKQRIVAQRKEVVAKQTSMLAEKIKAIELKLAKKVHDGEKLYASVAPSEIVDLLAEKGIKVTKSQIIFEKPIKTKGNFEVIVKLSSRLQQRVKLKVVGE